MPVPKKYKKISMDKIKICPQTLYKFKSSQDLLTKTLDQVKSLDWKYNPPGRVGRHPSPKGKDQYLIAKNIIFKNLHIWFNECLDLVKNDLEYCCEKLSVCLSWVNCTSNGEWHVKHMHNNSILSGIYYLTDTNTCTMFGVDSIWNYDKYTGGLIKLSYSNEDTMSIIHRNKPVAGDLIIFPSILYHGVEVHTEEQERYTVSFNSFIDGNLGYDQFLSGLNCKLE